MTTLATWLWIGSVLLDTAGRLAFKSAAVTGNVDGEWQRGKGMLRSPTLWAGILCFCLEFVVWLALLSLIPLPQAILIGSINLVLLPLAGGEFFPDVLAATRTA